MTDNAWRSATEWLTVPDVAEILGEPLSRVRRLIDERYLPAVRIDNVVRIPALALLDGEPLASLRGTLIVLNDAGFSGDEAVEWLFTEEETIGRTPIEALRAGHKSEVRRVAQALA